MAEQKDIRWKQRFSNYCKALSNFCSAVELAKKRPLSDLEKQGVIQSFEFTQELAWKTLKDFIEYQGSSSQIFGSKDAVRFAFSLGIIDNGDIWMDMIESRNSSSHTYDNETADEIATKAIDLYFDQFSKLKDTLEAKL